MSFEKTLTYVAEESLRREYSPSQMKTLFDQYFPVVSFESSKNQSGNDVNKFTLPAPRLWNIYSGNSDSIYWSAEHGNPELVKQRLEHWKGTGDDGLVDLILKRVEGKHHLWVEFQPMYRIPKNARAVEGCRLLQGESGTLLDHVWVYPKPATCYANYSKHGTLYCDPEEGSTYFHPTKEDLRPIKVHTSIENAKISAFSLQVIDPQWNEMREFISNPVLGDGTLTELLKHLQYEQEMNSLVKESIIGP